MSDPFQTSAGLVVAVAVAATTAAVLIVAAAAIATLVQPTAKMSKLSDVVKQLVNANHARPGYARASAEVQPALAKFASSATEKRVGLPAWVTISVRYQQCFPHKNKKEE